MSDRRGFLKSAAAGIVGTLLAAGTGWLAFGSGEPCWTSGGCRHCSQLDGCEEAEARLTRLQRRPEPNASDHEPTGEESMKS